jgi:CPA1 family monovalent cation:H+ antiporter
MREVEIILILLAIITALAQVTDKVKIPYPVLLVVAGMAIGLVPGLPRITLDPEVVFVIFLPPLLYSACWTTSWPDFKAAKRPITLLAIGCVLFTTIAVAAVAHYFIPGFPWPVAFVLGAIISPPDAVAATAATKGLFVPRRIITVLEGESLVNDATGLIAYRYALAAVATGQFVLWQAGLQFLVVAGGGILLGVTVGQVLVWVHKITRGNATVDTSLTFLAPYVSYLAAEELHVSGVLAVVSTGLFIVVRSSEIFTHQTRLQAVATWNTVIFLLNGIVFILIGLQLPAITEGIGQYSWPLLLGYGALVSGAAIVGRILWVYPAAYVPRWLSRGIRERETATNLRTVTIIAWTGMRGVVSLAAALALPLTLPNGAPFPQRDLILFLTFCVILSTLVLQGLTLPLIIRLLGLKADGNVHQEEAEVRLRIARSVIEHIEENLSLGVMTDDVLAQVKAKYEIRIARLMRKAGYNIRTQLDDAQVQQFHQVQHDLIRMERKSVIQLRREGKISDEVLRRLEFELDLEESRVLLEVEMAK